MNAWEWWKAANIDAEGRHKARPEWHVTGIWMLERSDGFPTCHKFDGPYGFWKTTVEESMRVVDEFVPLGGDPPEGTTDWSGLWQLDREAKEASV